MPTATCVRANKFSFYGGISGDPLYRGGDNYTRWVPHQDWVYTRKFPTPDVGAPGEALAILSLDFLDTLAQVSYSRAKLG